MGEMKKREKDRYFNMGFHFTWGAIACVGVLMVLGLVFGRMIQPVDDCDKNWWHRCGLEVVTDHKTGKQYLLSPHGGIIERGTR
jgi:hypothetical protein